MKWITLFCNSIEKQRRTGKKGTNQVRVDGIIRLGDDSLGRQGIGERSLSSRFFAEMKWNCTWFFIVGCVFILVYFVLHSITLQINQMKSTKEQHTRLLPKAWVLHPSSQGLVSQPYRRFLVSFTFNWRKTKGKECAPLFFFNEREINKATKRSQVLSERFMCCSSLFIYKRMKEAREMNKERRTHTALFPFVLFFFLSFTSCFHSIALQVNEKKGKAQREKDHKISVLVLMLCCSCSCSF